MKSIVVYCLIMTMITGPLHAVPLVAAPAAGAATATFFRWLVKDALLPFLVIEVAVRGWGWAKGMVTGEPSGEDHERLLRKLADQLDTIHHELGDEIRFLLKRINSDTTVQEYQRMAISAIRNIDAKSQRIEEQVRANERRIREDQARLDTNQRYSQANRREIERLRSQNAALLRGMKNLKRNFADFQKRYEIKNGVDLNYSRRYLEGLETVTAEGRELMRQLTDESLDAAENLARGALNMTAYAHRGPLRKTDMREYLDNLFRQQNFVTYSYSGEDNSPLLTLELGVAGTSQRQGRRRMLSLDLRASWDDDLAYHDKACGSQGADFAPLRQDTKSFEEQFREALSRISSHQANLSALEEILSEATATAWQTRDFLDRMQDSSSLEAVLTFYRHLIHGTGLKPRFEALALAVETSRRPSPDQPLTDFWRCTIAEIERPERLHGRNPYYPDVARRAKVEGRVILRFAVCADGSTRGVEVLQGPGMGLNQASIQAVKGWKFEAASCHGRELAYTWTQPIDFLLEGHDEGLVSISDEYFSLGLQAEK